ncbi:MAG: DNA-3-methyladenine glycosylase [Verrucomicrobiae bacterium]|nr:DNA-3-methyladenine glycosylase [Verrucomicrobiae bacterium]MCP5533463.1 DNA-3-methyladenine glycosylase [Akkermansiaceae bacterium]MCP5543834.1 DNA-3-methyladenine glycosylase [Akkermansiaceae bacterium]MCP5546496.1 DNA-3-methyladenine glycosylase [Akkermansiaceae bacterium]
MTGRDETIGREFFRRAPVRCARELIGCTFVWGGCSGRIVETEAYHAVGDPACHTFSRPGARAFVAEQDAGDAYVYLNYGMHWLFNILVKGPDGEGFVLFRALEPMAGVDSMRERSPRLPVEKLAAGPGRLTRSFGIAGADHRAKFLDAPGSVIVAGPSRGILSGPRIGISKATELPWRFGERGSRSLSRPFP